LDELTGFLVVDKPRGPTSRDAVNRLQRTLPRGVKLGHTGTLDPMATGVLVLCLGQATRLASQVQAMGKGYTATVKLGATSTTDDAEGNITPVNDTAVPAGDIEAALLRFTGVIQQAPPAYSAIKVQGQRAYALARRGEGVELAEREVHVKSITLDGCVWPELHLTIECGKGTYIRSLARDIGAALGCGGHLTALRRTHVGLFDVQHAVPPEASIETIRAHLRPLRDAVPDWPTLVLNADEARRYCCGQRLSLPHLSGDVAVLDAAGKLLGLGRVQDGALHGVLVLAQHSAG